MRHADIPSQSLRLNMAKRSWDFWIGLLRLKRFHFFSYPILCKVNYYSSLQIFIEFMGVSESWDFFFILINRSILWTDLNLNQNYTFVKSIIWKTRFTTSPLCKPSIKCKLNSSSFPAVRLINPGIYKSMQTDNIWEIFR